MGLKLLIGICLIIITPNLSGGCSCLSLVPHVAPAAGCAVAELSGKERPEIVCIGGATHNLVIYRAGLGSR